MLTLKAPAKINWFLLLLRKRLDGYHSIQSLMQCVSLYDELVFEEADTVAVKTEGADIPEKDNLVFRAAQALRMAAGHSGGVHITLRKNIPLAAGLGGGSSDAAAALRGLNKLWDLQMSIRQLSALALDLGSDVPFFLRCPAALAEGRGEKLTPVEIGRKAVLLLAKPVFGVTAAWAYRNASRLSEKPLDADRFLKALNRGDWDILSSLAHNDLEKAVLSENPEISAIKRDIAAHGALMTLMSGSGPTVFGVFRDRRAAETAQHSLTAPWSAVVEGLA